MFLIGKAAFWLFGPCFGLSTASFLLSLEAMRKQVNLVLPANERVFWRFPLPRSLEDFFWRNTIVGRSLGLLETHGKHYPSSSLPKVLGLSAIGTVLSFVGLIVAGALAP